MSDIVHMSVTWSETILNAPKLNKMPNGGINGRKRNFGKLNTPMGDFDWLCAQSNYRVKYFEGSNYVKMTETQN